MQATDEIKTVRRVSKDGGSYVVKCPHCKRIMGIEGEDLDEMRGEQYKDPACGGWLEIGRTAIYSGRLDAV